MDLQGITLSYVLLYVISELLFSNLSDLRCVFDPFGVCNVEAVLSGVGGDTKRSQSPLMTTTDH